MTVAKKKTVGQRLVESMREFTDALEKEDFSQLTVRSAKLELNTNSYDSKLVKETRGILNVSQSIFAQFLGVSKQTISSWEQDEKKPNLIACRFMDEIRHNPKYWKQRLSNTVRIKTKPKQREKV